MKTYRLTLSAMFLAIEMVLPFLTGQLQGIGNMLLPMHLPIFLCGLLCGWKHGLILGIVLPIFRSLLFGMPPLYPTALAMTVELASYGCVIALVYQHFQNKTGGVWIALGVSMIIGRILWGITMLSLLGLQGNAFSWQAFIVGAFANAMPGIILQLVLIPGIMHLVRPFLTPYVQRLE